MRGLLIWLGAAVVVIGATAGLLWWTTATAAQFRVEGDRLAVSGQLTLASTERLDRLLEEHRGLTTLVVGDVADVSDALSILQKGQVVRAAGLATELADGVTLTGDAVYLFLAGTERRVGDGAGLVVTDWQTRVGPASLLPREHPAHEERRDYMRRMLGSEDFYWYMLEAGEGAGRPVTEADLAAFGIVTAE
jgi:hypothetical protein